MVSNGLRGVEIMSDNENYRTLSINFPFNHNLNVQKILTVIE